MENKKQKAHVLSVPYPAQGHINPILQFSKRLASKGLKATLATTLFIANSVKPNPLLASTTVQLDTISDGYDEGGFDQAESIGAYLARMEVVGSKTLAELILRHKNSPHPIDYIIYDPFLPWALDVAKEHGLVGVAFFTQNCTVNYLYYCIYHQILNIPKIKCPIPVSNPPGLEWIDQLQDMPSYVTDESSYPAYFEMIMNQFSNVHKADFFLVNSVLELEQMVVHEMSKMCPLLTIGPTIPSIYLDDKSNSTIKDDKEYNNYGIDLFDSTNSSSRSNIKQWLNHKPTGSVVFVSFGSMANLSVSQMEELAFGLKASNSYFLWVVRAFEESKLPEKFLEEINKSNNERGLLVNWSSQLEILSNEAVGCFLTHCGWNSTLEGVSLGVPMVCMPQWTDQPTNSKLVEEVWKIGIRFNVDENGIASREEVEFGIRKVMEGEKGTEFKKNALKWRSVIVKAFSDGGSSANNIDMFVSQLINMSF